MPDERHRPQQIEYGPRGLPNRFGRNKCLPDPAVLRSGKDGIAIRQVGKGPGFGSRAMNHMVMVDDMAMLAVVVIRSPPARQRLGPDVASKQFQAIIVGAQVQLITDQPRGDRSNTFRKTNRPEDVT